MPFVYTVYDADGMAVGSTTVFPHPPSHIPHPTHTIPPSAADVDFSQADLPDKLKAYMSAHLKPPFPFEPTDENSARGASPPPLTSYVALQPTREQLQRLSLESGPGNTESVKMKPSPPNQHGHSTSLVISQDNFNTSIDDTCNAFAIYHTPGVGWTIREAPVRFGLHIDPNDIKELDTHYGGLKWFVNQGLSDITLTLKSPTESGRSTMRTGGDDDRQSRPPGMSRRKEREVALDEFVRDYGSTQEQAGSGFDHSRPSIPLFGYSDAAPYSETLNPTDSEAGSTLQLVGGCSLRGRMPIGEERMFSGKERGFSRSQRPPDVDLSARLTCELPSPGL